MGDSFFEGQIQVSFSVLKGHNICTSGILLHLVTVVPPSYNTNPGVNPLLRTVYQLFDCVISQREQKSLIFQLGRFGVQELPMNRNCDELRSKVDKAPLNTSQIRIDFIDRAFTLSFIRAPRSSSLRRCACGSCAAQICRHA